MQSTPFRVRHGIIVETSSNTSTAIVANNQVLTGSASSTLVDLATAWNTTGNPTAIKLNVTNTASGANSALMDLQVSGNSRFYVSANGNVGIGTSTPSSSLTIGNAKNIALLSNTTTDGKISFVGGNGGEHGSIGRTGNYNLSLYSFSSFYLSSNDESVSFNMQGKPVVWLTYSGSIFKFAGYSGYGGEVVMLNNATNEEVFHAYLTSPYKIVMPKGDFSIGLTSPTAKFTVANSTNATSAHIYGTYTDASNYERLSLSANSSGHYIIGEKAGTGSPRNLFLGANNATAVTIDTAGRVGIGVTVPTSKTEILTGIGTGLPASANNFTLRHSSINGDSMLLNMGVSNVSKGGHNQGHAYIQATYWGGSNDNPIVLQPIAGGVVVGDNIAHDWKLVARGTLAVAANTNTAGAYGGKIAFPAQNYSGETAWIASIFDAASWSGGTGLAFGTISGADVAASAGIERLRISSNGNVGIGVTSPSSALDVNGKITTRFGGALRGYFGAPSWDTSYISMQHALLTESAASAAIHQSSGGDTTVNAAVGRSLLLRINNDSGGQGQLEFTNRKFVFSGSNVAIGMTAPTAKFTVADGTSPTSQHIYGTYTDVSNYERLNLTANSSGHYIIGEKAGTGSARPLYLGANNATAVTIVTAGNLGVGTTSPINFGSNYRTVHISATTSGALRVSDANSTNILDVFAGTLVPTIRAGTGSPLVLSANAAEAMRITSDGNVGIGTTTPAYKLEVAGSFAAQTKSFVIDHQSKPNHKLRHGSLEGPENGVYVRGRTNTNVIELPEYWTWLIDDESITVTLTPIGTHQNLYVEKIEDNKVYIAGEANINCFYMINAERKDVDKLIVEF